MQKKTLLTNGPTTFEPQVCQKKEKERNKTTSSVRQARLGTVFFFFFASQATNTCSTKRSFLSQWHEPMMRTQKNKLPLLYNHQARCVNELKRACGKEKKKCFHCQTLMKKRETMKKTPPLAAKKVRERVTMVQKLWEDRKPVGDNTAGATLNCVLEMSRAQQTADARWPVVYINRDWLRNPGSHVRNKHCRQ